MKRIVLITLAIAGAHLLPTTSLRAFNPDLVNPLVFDCNFYRQIHSDLSSMTCAQAEDHWLNYGIDEGRAASPVFAVSWYVNFYSDLYGAFGCANTCNYEGAVDHYVDYGRGEGRWGHPAMGAGTPYTDYTMRVMDVASDSFAYAFHSIKISGYSSPYLAVFDTESWGCTGYPIGDSMGARYGSAMAFGSRSRGENIVVGRSTEDEWDCEDEPTPSSHYLKYGASNPHMIKNPSGNTWVAYWLDVLHDSAIPSAKRLYGEGDWRHFMMFGMIDANYTHPISSAPFWYYTGDHVTQSYWCCYFQPASGPLVDLDMTYAAPISETGTGKYLSSEFTHEDGNLTQGLIGSVTSDSEGQYLYYTDIINGNATLLRRTIDSSMVSMSSPTVLKTFTGDSNGRYILVNYHQTADRYVVLYYCKDDDELYTPDVCIQTFEDRDLTGIDLDFENDSETHGLRLIDDPYVPKTGQSGTQFQLNQFGVRRDEYGRMFNDSVVPCPYGTTTLCGQVTVYLPMGTNVSSQQSPWGRHVYAKTVYFPYD